MNDHVIREKIRSLLEFYFNYDNNSEVDDEYFDHPGKNFQFKKLRLRIKNGTAGLYFGDTLIFSFNYNSQKDNTDNFYVSNLGTVEQFRNQGFAKKVIKEFLNFTRKEGKQNVILDVYKNNLVAISLYKSIGFKINIDYGDHYEMKYKL